MCCGNKPWLDLTRWEPLKYKNLTINCLQCRDWLKQRNETPVLVLFWAGLHWRAGVQGAVSRGGRFCGAAGPLEPAGGEEFCSAGGGHTEGQPPVACVCALVWILLIDLVNSECLLWLFALSCLLLSIVCISVLYINQDNLDKKKTRLLLSVRHCSNKKDWMSHSWLLCRWIKQPAETCIFKKKTAGAEV